VRILFDECVPKRLRKLLQKYDVKTVQEAGWAGVKNGELLKKASEGFDVLITVDRNLAFQQNPHELAIPILVLHAPTNRLKDLERHVPEILQRLQTNLTKTLHHIGR
jgi:predicted nuclease of predicted toxin-antitoxin system